MKSQISKYFETRFSKYQCGFHKGSVGNGGAFRALLWKHYRTLLYSIICRMQSNALERSVNSALKAPPLPQNPFENHTGILKM